MKATKKPITIEFFPCEEKYLEEIFKWKSKENSIEVITPLVGRLGLKIGTLEGSIIATEQDMIIKGINGEVYPCKKDIFYKTYNVNKCDT